MFPHLITATNVPRLTKVGDVDWGSIDAAFCCLPHATTQEILNSLPKHIKVRGPVSRLSAERHQDVCRVVSSFPAQGLVALEQELHFSGQPEVHQTTGVAGPG